MSSNHKFKLSDLTVKLAPDTPDDIPQFGRPLSLYEMLCWARVVIELKEAERGKRLPLRARLRFYCLTIRNHRTMKKYGRTKK